jgi:rod shape-determining protein MreC
LGVVLIVGAVALIATHAGLSSNTEAVMQTADDAAAGAGRVATGPARASDDFFSRLTGMWTATSRVQQLERENRDLQQWRELAQRLAERNARYEALLRMPADSFGEGADIDHSIAAQLVLDSGGPFTRTLVANAGADHGVRVGYIAVNENGLIGRVVSVGHRSARVLMVDDYNSRIPVMGEASRVRAVLAGQANSPPDLYTRPFEMQSPRLDFIVGAQALREGERIITSGDGGLFPRGIPVGVAHHEGDGAWRVALAASQRPNDFVRIVPVVGGDLPETTATPNQGPPLGPTSSVTSVGRDLTAAAPAAALPTPAATPPRPRRVASTDAAATPTINGAPVASAPPPAAPPAAPPALTPNQ